MYNTPAFYAIRQGNKKLLCFDKLCETECAALQRNTSIPFFFILNTEVLHCHTNITCATSYIFTAAFHFKLTLSFGKCIVILSALFKLSIYLMVHCHCCGFFCIALPRALSVVKQCVYIYNDMSWMYSWYILFVSHLSIQYLLLLL